MYLDKKSPAALRAAIDRVTSIFGLWVPPSIHRLGPDQVNAVRTATPVAMAGNIFNATVILGGFWGEVSTGPLLVWYALVCTLCVYGTLRWAKSRQCTTYRPDRLRRAVMSHALFGLPWGMLPVMYLGSLPAHSEILLATITAGVAAAGSIYLAPVFPVAIAYTGAVTLPVIATAILLAGNGYTYYGLLALSYAAFLWSIICWTAQQHIARSEANIALREKTTVLQAIVDHFPGGITFTDREQRLVLCNDTARNLLGLPPHVLENGPAHTHQISDGFEEVFAENLLASGSEFARELERPNGAILDLHGVPVPGIGFLTTYVDVTEKRRSEKEISHMARHDALTGLPNRHVFRESLIKAQHGSRAGDRSFALIGIDLDRFKEVNDTLGHPVGDLLLIEVASRIGKCIRSGDVFARLGGDEFAILQWISDTETEPAALAERIQKVLAQPLNLGEHTVSINVSLGIALSPQDATDVDDLAKKSDLALLAAKSAGRNQFRFFEAHMDEALRTRRAIEHGLGTAIEKNELELLYQPILDASSNSIRCVEALLRWNSSELGSVAPDRMIPVAEETGSIVLIGRWVITEACKQAAKWPQQVRVAVNLSPVQLEDPHLLETVRTALDAAGLAPGRLELEVTETAALGGICGSFAKLMELRKLGVRIALDDFGQAFSSIAHLKNFPFDKIKIDREFIRDLSSDDPYKLAIVRMIADLGAELGIATTAEGVETVEQLKIVMASKCSEIQGYIISRPVPAHLLTDFLRSEHPAASTEPGCLAPALARAG